MYQMSLDQVSNVLWSVATDLQPAFIKKLQVLSKANKRVTLESAHHMCTTGRCMISALGIVCHFYLFVKKIKGVIKVKLYKHFSQVIKSPSHEIHMCFKNDLWNRVQFKATYFKWYIVYRLLKGGKAFRPPKWAVAPSHFHCAFFNNTWLLNNRMLNLKFIVLFFFVPHLILK